MADVTVKYPEAGLASFEQLDSHLQSFLLSGAHPPLASFPMEVADGQALEQFQVVGYDGSGLLVPAEVGAPGIQAIGVVTQAVAASAPTGTTVPVFYSGCFDPNYLVWDATFNTDALKADAFKGAPTPTQILIRERL